MKQHDVVPVINRADDRTLLLSDGRLEVHTRSSYYAFVSSLSGARLPLAGQSSDGVGSQHSPYSPDHSSSLRATPLSFSRARYSSTRKQIVLAGHAEQPAQLSHR